jgi:hypothetical protein
MFGRSSVLFLFGVDSLYKRDCSAFMMSTLSAGTPIVATVYLKGEEHFDIDSPDKVEISEDPGGQGQIVIVDRQENKGYSF